MTNNIIIKRPIISEKSMNDASLGWYTFEVDLKANKKQIAQEVAKLFNVQVKSVSTEILKGKKKRAGRKRQIVKEANFKKAYVRLEAGQKIDLFETKKE